MAQDRCDREYDSSCGASVCDLIVGDSVTVLPILGSQQPLCISEAVTVSLGLHRL